MIEGVFMVIFNLLITGAVLKYKKMRKNKAFLIIMGLALADAIKGIGMILRFQHRAPKVISGQYKDRVSPWYCMTQPAVWFLLPAGQLQSLIAHGIVGWSASGSGFTL